ncbi:MAG: hypothetical protein D6830_02620 [Ignavibacteria bacterium]|nr:MAG: hypothetical protein D6830_02620 [Ignavibacteria bacterium]
MIELTEDVENVKKTELTLGDLEQRILQLSKEFYLDQSWVKKVNVANTGKDSLKFVYNFSIPRDVLITDVLKRINELFPEKELTIKSEETLIRKITKVYFYVNDILYLQLNLKKDKKIKRVETKIALIVEGFEELGGDEKNNLLNSPFVFCVLVSPEENAIKKLEEIESNNKQYALYLKNFIDAEDYKIDEDLSRIRLKSSIISIATDFKNAAAFFINTKAEIYHSIIYNFLKDKFKEKGIVLRSIFNYKSLSSSSLKEIKSKFRFYEESMKGKQTAIFRIRAVDLLKIKSEIEKYLMRGNKIVPLKIK